MKLKIALGVKSIYATMGANAGAWVPLKTNDDTFQFFARLTIADGGYTIDLADVATLECWTESLSKERVTIRAEDDDCLIDANDPTQHVLLLEKLGQALREGEIDFRKTSRALRISVALKMDAGTFGWTFRVAQVSDKEELVTLQREFFQGLVTVSHSLISQVQHLESELSKKDYHIGAMQKLLADTEPGRSTEYKPRRFVEAAYKTDPVKLIDSWKVDRAAATEKEVLLSLAGVDAALWTLPEVVEKVEEVEAKPDVSFTDDFVDDVRDEVSRPPTVPEPVPEKTPEVSQTAVPTVQPDLNTPDQCETEDEDEEGVVTEDNTPVPLEEPPAESIPSEPVKPAIEPPSSQPPSSQPDSQNSPKRRIGSLKHVPSSPIKPDEPEQDAVLTETLKRKQLEESLQKQRSTVKKKRRF